MYQASPSRACCTAPGSIRGRSPIRAELFPVGPCRVEPPGLLDHLHHPGGPQEGVGVGHGVEEQPARAGPDQPALLSLIPQPVRGLG